MTKSRHSFFFKSVAAFLAFTTVIFTTPVSAAVDPNTLPTGYQAEYGNSSYSQNGNVGTLESHGGPTIGSNDFFNIGSAATYIANIDTAHLNRVRSGSPSEIFGSMQINGGKFFLVNSGGIYFAPGSQVNAAGLVASTLNISNQDFINGKYHFTQEGLPAAIVNEGNMTIGSNGLALIGGSVQNSGVIQANESNVILASGKEMTLSFDNSGLISVLVDKQVSDTVVDVNGKKMTEGVANSGIIRANGGKVVMTAEAMKNIFDKLVNNRGIVEANSVGSKTGEIELSSRLSSGIVANSGVLNAKGVNAGEKGGKVVVEGEKVGLMENSKIDVSGSQGGGQVNVGGGFQGKDSNIRNADVVYVDPTAKINADATVNGNGGNVAVWADDATRFFGSISATGGDESGNGGSVEVSGKNYLAFEGDVDASSPHGLFGTLLLDPKFIEIVTSGGSAYNSGTNNLFANSSGLTTKLTPASLNINANVTLQATTDVTFTDAVNMTFNNRDLTVQAGRSILINNSVAANGNISMTANDSAAGATNRDAGAGNITMGASGSVTANGTSHNVALTIGSTSNATYTPGSMTLGNVSASGDRITLTGAGAANTVTQNASTALTASDLLLSGPSSFTLNQTTNNVTNLAANNTGAVTYKNSSDLNVTTVNGVNGITTSDGAVDVAAAGNLTVSQAISTGSGNVALSATRDVNLSGASADVTTTGSFTATADSNQTGTGDFIQSSAGSAIAASSASITAHDYNTNGTINVGAGNVSLNTIRNADTIGVGDTTRTMNISDSELDRITAGSITVGSATNSGGIFVGTSEALTQGAKNFTFNTDGTTTFQTNSFTTTGDVSVVANNVAINSALNANNVNLRTNAAGTPIGVGAAAGTFQVSDTELDNINASGLVTIGDNAHTGGITVDTISSNNALKFISNNVTLKNAISTASKAIEFAGNIILGANTTVTTSGANATFTGAVTGGGKSLNVNAGSGDVKLTGNATGLSSNTITGTNIGLKSVTTTGAQSYTGTTNLNGTYNTTNADFTVTGATNVAGTTAVNTTGGNILFNSAVDGANALTLNAGSGNSTFGAAVGTTTPLLSLGVSAANIFLKNVKTTGSQTYTATAKTTLGGDLQATGAGNGITFNGNTAIADLDSNAATVDTVNITTNGGDVTFNNKLDGTVDYKQAISISAGSGNIIFNDSIGSIVPLFGMTLNNTGAQTLPAIINLLNFTLTTLNLTANKVFNLGTATVNVGNVNTNGHDLTLIADEINFTAGADSVLGGGNLVLKSFTASLKTVLAGAAEFSNQLDLTTTDLLALKDGFSSITIGGASSSGGVDINAFTFKDPTSILSPISGAINVLGTLTGTGDASFFFDGSGSTLHLFADIMTNSTSILISDNVVLEVANVLLKTNVTGAGADVTITGTVNGASSGVNSLAVTAGTGNIDVQGNVGATALNNLTVNSATTSRFGGNVTTTGNQNITAGTIQTNGAYTATTAGSQVNFNGNVTLQNNTLFSTNNGDVNVTGKINGAKDLTVTAGSGNLSVTDKIGNGTALNSLTVNSANNASFGDNVTTNGNQAITATTIKTSATHTVNNAASTINLNGNVALQNDTNLNTNNGNVTVVGTIDGAKALNVAAGTGNVSLQNSVGSTTALTSVSATGTSVGLKAVKTTGAQTYTGATTLNGDLQSTAAGAININGAATIAGDTAITTAGLAATDDITFSSTINGARNLVLNSGLGDVLVSGTTGQTLSLLSLTATGATIGVQSVKTTGTQTYNGATTLNGDLTSTDAGATLNLNGDTTLAADTNLNTNNGNVTATGAIDGNKALAITAGSGNVDLQQNVGTGTALTSLTVNNANIARFGGNVTTAGAQNVTAGTIQTNGTHSTTNSPISLNGNVTLQNDTNLNSTNGNVTVTGTIDGAKALGIDAGTGNVDLQNNVGATSALSSLTVSNATTARFGGSVKTSGNQDIKAGTIQTNGAHTMTTNGSFAKFDGNTELQNNTTVLTNNGDITFTGTVNGAESLSLNAGTLGNIVVGGAAGSSTALASIAATGSTITLDKVTTAGAQTYNGATTLNGDLTSTTAGAITVNGDTTLGADITILTAGLASTDDITLNGKIDGAQNLVLDAGAGDVLLTGSTGSTTPLTSLTATGNTIGLKSVQTTGTQVYNGTTTLGGDLTTAGADVTVNGDTRIENLNPGSVPDSSTLTVSTSGGNISFNGKVDGTVDYDQKLTTSAGAGNLTFGDSIGSIHPLYTLTLDNTGTQILPAIINVQNFIATTLNLAADFVLSLGANSTIELKNVNTNGHNLTLIADEINFTGGADKVLGGGNLTLQPFTDGLTINIADLADTLGAMDLTQTDLLAIKDGFDLITIGSPTGNGKLNYINAGNAFTFKDAVKLLTPQVGGAINVIGKLMSTQTTSTITLIGSHATTHLFADIITAGADILINDKVIVENNVSLDTTNGVPAGANVTVTDTIEGKTIGGQNLTINAGTGGNILLSGAVGAGTRLGVLLFEAANNLTATDLNAASIKTGAAGITGTANFNGKLNANGAAGIDLNGAVFNFNDSVIATNTGGFTLTNTGDANLFGTVNVDGAFLQDGAGTVNVSNNITTNANNITFAGPVVLKQNVQFSTGAGIGDIWFQNTVDADTANLQNLTLLAGAGNIKFDKKVGGSKALNAFVITSVNDLTALDSINAVSLEQASGTGTSTFDAITTTGATGIDLNGKNFTMNGAINATNGDMHVTNSGTLTLNGAVTTTGAFVQDGLGQTVLNNDITTTNSLISFHAPVILGVGVPATFTLNSNGGAINFDSTINGSSDAQQNLTLDAGAGNIVFSGAIGLSVGRRLADLLITNANDVTASGAIKAKSITQAAGTGTTTFDGALDTNGNGIDLTGNNFNINQLVITTGGGTGNVTIDNSGLLLIGANGDMVLDGFFDQTGTGDVATFGDITTSGSTISFNGNVTLAGNVTLNTTNGSVTGNDITFNKQVVALASDVQGLNLNAGTSGNILFSDVVGTPAQRLGNLTITNANNTTFTKDVTAASIRQIASGALGTTTFNGKVNTDTVTGIDLTGNAFTFNDNVTTTNNGGVNVTNSGAFTIDNGSTLDLDGSFVQDGTGANFLNGNIKTTGDQIVYTSATNLTGDSSLDTTNGGFPAGAQILFVSTLDGNSNLTVQSGLANTLFNDNVGSTNAIGDGLATSIVLNSNGTTTFNKDLSTTTGMTAAGPVVFNGNVTLGDGSGAGFASTFNNNVTFNTGLAGKTFYAEDGATFGQLFQNHHVTLTGTSLAMSTTDSNLLFNSDVNGATNLTLDSGLGNTEFVEAVGNSTALGTGTGSAITINTATGGTTTFDKTVQANSGIASANGSDVVFKGNVTLNNGDTGSALLGNTTFNGLSAYNGFDGLTFGTTGANTVTLASGPVSLVSNNGAVTFEAAVEGPAALSVTAGTSATSNVNFKSTVGAASNLASLTVVSSNETRFGDNVTTTGNQTVSATTVKTNAVNESTNGNIAFNGNLELESNTTLKTDNAAGGNVTVTGATNSASNSSLTVLANTATVDLQGSIGAANAPSTLSVTNTGGTTRFGGNVTTTGTQDVTSGTIQTNGKFETTDAGTGTITFNGTTELQNNTTFKTNGSNVTLNGNVIDALENLTFNTGAGDVQVNGNIGTSLLRIGQLLIQDVHNFTLTGDVFATSILQQAAEAGGLTWFQGNMDTNGAAGINLKGNDITIGTTAHVQTVTTTNGGGFTVEHDLNPTGVLTIYSDMNLNGTFNDLGFGPTNLFGNITTSGGASDIIFAGDLLLGDGATNLVSGNNIEFDGFVDGTNSGLSDLNLTAGNKITFKKNVGGGNVAGSSTRLGILDIIKTKDAEFNQVALALGGAITATSFVQGGVQTPGTGTTTINGLGSGVDVNTAGVNLKGNNFTFNNAPINVTGGGVTITQTGVLTFDSNSDVTITGGGAFLQNGTGTAFTGSDITTDGGKITWNDPTLTNNVTMDTTNGGGTPTGGDITFNDHIDSDALATLRDLTLNSGTAGNIVFNEVVGGTVRLGNLTITNANDVTANKAVSASTVQQNAGQGTTSFNGTLDTNGAGGIVLTGNNFTFGDNTGTDTVTTTNGGPLTINNSGLLLMNANANMNLDGAFTQTDSNPGTSAVKMANQITTTNDNVTFNSGVTLIGNSGVDSNGGDITFAGLVNSDGTPRNLTLESNAGNISTQSMGTLAGGRLGALTVTSVNNWNANDSIMAQSLTQNAGTGLSHFFGNIDTNTAPGTDLTGNQFQFDGNVLATAGKINVNGTGTVIVGDALTDTMIADLAITLRGDTITLNSTLESDADLSGNEGISVTADRAVSSDVLAHNTITTHGGNITIAANNDVLFDAIADVFSHNGNVSVTADKDGDQIGALTMAYVSAGLPTDDRTEIQSGTGTITLSAGQDVTLGGLTSGNTTAGAVSVTSTNGKIVDGGESINNVLLFDIDARNGGVQLTAKHGIGLAADPNGALEIWSTKLAATTFDGDINVNLNDPLVQGIDALPGSGPVEITNASVTGGPGNITINQLADATMTVDNASTLNGAINFSSIADLNITGLINAQGTNAAVNLTADAAPGKNGLGDVIIQPNAIVSSQGPVTILGVNARIFGTVFANTLALIVADTDIFLGLVQANVFNLKAGRNIEDTNGDGTNLLGNLTSFLTAGGIIGRAKDPIEFTLNNGDLVLNVGGSADGVSASLHGSLPGNIETNLTEGLVLFNAHEVAGKPLPIFRTSLDQILNIIAFDRNTNKIQDLQQGANLQRGLGLVPGLEKPFVPTVDTQTSFNKAPNVMVNEKEERLWKRKVRPAAVVTPTVPAVVKPVVVVTPPVEVKPVVTPVTTPVQPVVVKPIVTPVTTPLQPTVTKPTAFPPSAQLPIPPKTLTPAAQPSLQTPVTPAPTPTWVQKTQDWFRTNVQGQPSTLQPPAITGNRLFQQNVEEAPRTDKDKNKQETGH